MFVIRKRLDGVAGQPTGTRYNPECGCVETTVDGGATWQQNDGADPRKNTAYQLPAGGDACAAAGGMVAALHATVDDAILVADVLTLANALLLQATALIPITWMVDLFLEAAGGLLLIGGSLIEAAFTPTVYDQLLCILFCRLPPSGVASDEVLDNVREDIIDQVGEPVVVAVYDVVRAVVGFVGFTNAGVVDAGDPDACLDCECNWDKCWLGGDGIGDWVTPYTFEGRSAGAYVGDSIVGTLINETSVWANFNLSEELHIKSFRIDYSYNNPSPPFEQGIEVFINGVLYESGFTPSGSGSDFYNWAGDEEILSLGFLFASGASIEITRINVTGVGIEPATGVDC